MFHRTNLIFTAIAVSAVSSIAAAHTYERCDADGDHCVRVKCDHDGDRCTAVRVAGSAMPMATGVVSSTVPGTSTRTASTTTTTTATGNLARTSLSGRSSQRHYSRLDTPPLSAVASR